MQNDSPSEPTNSLPMKRPLEESSRPSLKRRLEDSNEDESKEESQAGRSPPQASTSGAQAKTHGKPQRNKKAARRDNKKDEGKGGRRDRRGTRHDGEVKEGENEPKGPRLPKRMCAVLIGFCGAGYNGMQMYVLLDFINLPEVIRSSSVSRTSVPLKGDSLRLWSKQELSLKITRMIL